MKQADREAYWRRHVACWRESGLSGLAYCEQAKVGRKQFYLWRKRLAEEAWLPVEVASLAGAGSVQIDVGGEVRIIVDADSSPLALRLALDALT